MIHFFGANMQFNLSNFLLKTCFFSHLPSEEMEKISSRISPRICEFQRGDTVISCESFGRELGFVIKGEAEVFREREDGTLIPLNSILAGESFGILTLFSDEESYPTTIISKKASSALFISRDDVIQIIDEYPSVAVKIIEFLTKKAIFLNKKVETFSSASVEEKLKNFVFDEARRLGNPLPFNYKKTAEKLGVGRASLYRAAEQLEKDGSIQIRDRKIYILTQNTKGTKK